MARQKTVFDKNMVAHVWAQQKQQSGKSSHGNFYFEGDTIYSYGSHFPIARFIERKGQRAVLLTTRTYSSTTSSHVSQTRRAIPPDISVFAVDNPCNSNVIEEWPHYKKAVADVVKAIETMRSAWSSVEDAQNAVTAAVDRANAFRKFFSLKVAPVKYPVIPQAVLDKAQERIAKAKVRRDARDEKIRAANDAREARTLLEYCEGQHHHLRNQEWGFAASLLASDHAAHDAAYPTRMERMIERWRNGERVEWDYNERPSRTMMRVNGDEVETSMGARFPVAHATRAFPAVLKCRQEGRTFETNGHTIPLGHFKIDRIEADGTVRAGCHVVEWSEIEAVAKQLGLI